MKARGSRAKVMHGTAKRTSGGLRKKDLKYNKHGRIVSRKMSLRAKKEKRLEKAGFKTKKGIFGSFKKGKRVSGRRSRRRSRRRQKGGTDPKKTPAQPPKPPPPPPPPSDPKSWDYIQKPRASHRGNP